MKPFYKTFLLLFLNVSFLVFTSFSQQAPGIEWQKSFGGTQYDRPYFVQQTQDGGYIIAGSTASNDGDVSGNHGLYDAWIIKLDGNGNLQWQKCLGGTLGDVTYFIQQTIDGGCIAAGRTMSNDGDVSGNHDPFGTTFDCWIVKLDSSGNLKWQKCFGGTDDDWFNSIEQTSDQGYIAGGWTYSNDGDVIGNPNNRGTDPISWIVKIDSIGNLQWQYLGGEWSQSVQMTIDSGYLTVGSDQCGLGLGSLDYWISKLDTAGNSQWSTCFGGTQSETPLSFQQISDRSYIIVGVTYSNDGNVTNNHGNGDTWLVKMDSSGAMQEQKCFGGTNKELGW